MSTTGARATEEAATSIPGSFVDALERAGVLDGAGRALGKDVRGALGPGAVKDAISGTWLGHAVHPPLTDVVIGSVLGAVLLDATAPGNARATAAIETR